MTSPIHSENFSGITPPALPVDLVPQSGTTTAITVASGFEDSSPNALQLGGSGGVDFLAYTETDSNSGNVSGQEYFKILNVGANLLFTVRGTTGSFATMSGYSIQVGFFGGGGVFLNRYVAGASSQIGTTVGDGSEFATNVVYRLFYQITGTHAGGGTTLEAGIQRMSDGLYLASGTTPATWASTPQFATSFTDTDPTGTDGAGRRGYAWVYTSGLPSVLVGKSLYDVPFATSFALSGVTSPVTVGSNIVGTVTPNGPPAWTESVAVTDDLSNSLGTLSFTAASATDAGQGFSSPAISGQVGSRTITATPSPTLGSPPTASVTVNSAGAATSYALTDASPASGPVSVASGNFTLQANGTPSTALVVTPSDSSGGGTFTPTSLTISDATAHHFTYTPATTGVKTISVAHTGGSGISGDPASVSYTSNAASLSTCFVAASGSDSHDGSSGSPFLTIAHAISQTATAATINLNGGDTFAESVTLTASRTLTSYGNGRATIAPPSSPNPVPITVTNCEGVTISNLILVASSVATASGAVYFNNTDGTRRTTSGVTVNGCDCSGAAYGVTFSTAAGGGWNGVTISNNTVHDCGIFGVYFSEAGGGTNFNYSNVQVHDNTIFNITGNATSQGSGIVLGNCDSSTGANAAQCVIQHNLIYNIGASAGASAGPAGIFPINSDGVLTQFNVVHDISSGTSNVDGVAFDHDFGTSNCTTQYNYAYNCEGAGFLLDGDGAGHVVRWNVFVNCGTRAAGGMVRLDQGGAIEVYNNTFAGGIDNGLSVASGHTANKKIFNNIFDCPSGSNVINISGNPDVSMVMEGNAYQAGSGAFKAVVNGVTYNSLAAFTTGTGLEATGHSKLTTASFTSTTAQALTPATIDLMTAFVLSPTATPALKAQGLNLQSIFGINPGTVDFLGNTLGSPYSIGAIDATTGSGGSLPTADEIASAVWAAATGTALASVLSGSSGITLAGIAATGSETFGVVSGIPGQIPANFTAGLFSAPGVFSTPALVHAPSGGSGGSDPWATDIIAGDYAANTAGALLLNRPYLAQSGSTTTFAMDADDALIAQNNVGLQLLFPSRSGSNQAGAGFTALITESNISTGVQTFNPPCPTAVDSTFYYTTFVPILNAHLAGGGGESATSVTGVVVSSTTTSVTISATGATVFNAAQNAYAGVVPRYLTFASGANRGPAAIVSSSSVANGHLTVGFPSTIGIGAATVGDEVEID